MNTVDTISTVNTSFMFKGTYDPNKEYQTGDVVILDEDTCVFDGYSFQTIDKIEVLNSSYESPKKIIYGTCKHCGAPLRDKTCEYCGVTSY